MGLRETYDSVKQPVGAVLAGIAFPVGLLANVAQLNLQATTNFALGAAAGIAMATSVAWILWSRSRGEGARKGAARRIVQFLHDRWFPLKNGRNSNGIGTPSRLDPDYRVSLWTLEPTVAKPTRWACQYRTHTLPKDSWPYIADVEKLRHAGVIMNAAANGVGLDVPGLIEGQRSDAALSKEYRDCACTTEEANESRSWPYATIMARVVRAQNGAVAAVLMIERKSGLPIETLQPYIIQSKEESSQAVEMCSWELQLVAELWAQAWEHS